MFNNVRVFMLNNELDVQVSDPGSCPGQAATLLYDPMKEEF